MKICIFLTIKIIKKKSTIEFVNTVYQDYKILYKFKKIIRDELPLNYFIYRNFKKILTNSKEKKINLLIENLKIIY